MRTEDIFYSVGGAVGPQVAGTDGRAHADAVAAGGLGLIEPAIGALEGSGEILAESPLGGAGGNRHAATDFGQRGAHALAKRLRALLRDRKDGQKFLAAPARHRVGASRLRRQHAGHDPQNLIAHGMAEPIVPAFEAIDVDHRHGKRSGVTLGAGELAGERFFGAATIAQARQHVDERLPLAHLPGTEGVEQREGEQKDEVDHRVQRSMRRPLEA